MDRKDLKKAQRSNIEYHMKFVKEFREMKQKVKEFDSLLPKELKEM